MTGLERLWGPKEPKIRPTAEEEAVWESLRPRVLPGTVIRVLASFSVCGLVGWALAQGLSLYAGFIFRTVSAHSPFFEIGILCLMAIFGALSVAKRDAIRSLRLRRAMEDDGRGSDGPANETTVQGLAHRDAEGFVDGT